MSGDQAVPVATRRQTQQLLRVAPHPEADSSLDAFLAWLSTDYLAPVREWIAADADIARGHVGSYG